MRNETKARIHTIRSYLPERRLTNQDLEKMVETSNEWIVSRTGMLERRLAEVNEFPSDMGAKAAALTLESAQVKAEEIDAIIVATMTPDFISPSTAGLIQAKIGAVKAAAFDIQAACTGFLYALQVAKAFIESGIYKNVLLVATEKMSAFVNYQDRSTCVLFGDGASAALITGSGVGLRIDQLSLGSDGSLADLVIIPAGGSRSPASQKTVEENQHYFQMNGNLVFKHAVLKMTAAAKDCLRDAGLVESDISWLVPHQANKRIIDAMAKQFNISDERVYKTVHKYGNTSASGIAIALDELIQENTIETGEHLLLTAFGGGLTWGAGILTKVEE